MHPFVLNSLKPYASNVRTDRARQRQRSLVTSRSDQRVEQLRERAKRLEEDVVTAKRAREASVAAYAELQTKYRDLRRGLDDQKRSHQASVGASDAEIEQLQARLTELSGYQQEVHSLRADVAALKADLSLRNQDAAQAQEEAKSLRGLLEQFAKDKENAQATAEQKSRAAREDLDALVAAARAECRREIALHAEKEAQARALVNGLEDAARISADEASRAREDRDRALRDKERAEARLRDTEDGEMVDRGLCASFWSRTEKGADEEILDLMSVF